MKLSSGDGESMILNTDSSAFDVRKFMSELVGYENGEVGGSTKINIGVFYDGGLIRLISRSSSSSNGGSVSINASSLIGNSGGVLSLTTSLLREDLCHLSEL